jgi:hypothetical protein
MNVKINFDHAAAVALFDQRFNAYNPSVSKVEKIYQQCHAHTEFGGNVFDLYKSLLNIPFAIGSVEIGTVGDVHGGDYHRFILINSKTGKIMVYKDGSQIRYITEDQYSVCATARAAGYTSNEGTVETYAMLEHLFKIPDSYAA